jgi:hypothetical protein
MTGASASPLALEVATVAVSVGWISAVAAGTISALGSGGAVGETGAGVPI